MSEARVAARYAKSLFDLAEERNLLEKINDDAEGFVKACHESRGLMNMLKSPVVAIDKKWHVINKLFAKKMNPMTISFIQIVLRKHREMLLALIFQQFTDMYREKLGILTAKIYTAVPVSDKVLEDIRKLLVKQTNQKIDLKTDISPEILGGFILKYGDKLVDASVMGQLRNLRKHLSNSN